MYIKSLDHRGRGIGIIDGKIVFVGNALPGEDVSIKIIGEHKNYVEAISTEIIKPITNRVKAKCPYYMNCGGCHLMHASYNLQIRFKQNKISNIIERYLDKNILINEVIYDRQYNYRNKISLHVNGQIGLYQKGSNDLVHINNCLICDSKINDKICKLNNLELKNINQIVIRVSDNEDIILIDCNAKIDISPIYDYFDNIIVKTDVLCVEKGHKYIHQRIGNVIYRISPESFFQVNYSIMKKMYDYVKKIINGYKNVLDLYCGTGSIALYISDVVEDVYGIEINKQAIIDANINKKINKIDNVSFTCSDTKNIKLTKYYDVIIVDPPRAGLNKQIMEQIIKSDCKIIVYVSCDPMTLVRDLKRLSSKYNIDFITPFDMFPNTYHVECVTKLSLKSMEELNLINKRM